jgi:L-fuconolactonase
LTVDAHQHFWDPASADYPWMTDEVATLRRRFGPEDLEPLLRAHDVDGTVLVQARHSLDETRWLLELAAATPFVLGVVGWLDLTRDVAGQVAELGGPLVGVRHQVHDEPDPDWLLRDDVQRGLAAAGGAGLAYDLLVRARELPAAVETVKRHPEVTFVLDHAGKRPRDDADWAAGTRALADLPNVVCKLSGLVTEWDPAGTAERALRWFGAERCLYGSDWPVCTLAASYGETLELVRSVAAPGDVDAVLAATAIRTYGLPPVRGSATANHVPSGPR